MIKKQKSCKELKKVWRDFTLDRQDYSKTKYLELTKDFTKKEKHKIIFIQLLPTIYFLIVLIMVSIILNILEFYL